MSDVWQEYSARLRGYISKRVGEKDEVDDILHDVFLKAHASLHTLKSSDRVVPWLFRISANAIADHYRSRKPWDELPDDLAAPKPERDHLAELTICLKPLIASLPEKYQTAIVLSEMDGLPQKEVATRLGISLSGTKSRVQRGREMLRKRLIDCCKVESGRGGITDYASPPKKFVLRYD